MRLWSNSDTLRGSGGFNPERRLLAAVLQRAITDYLTGDGDLQKSAEDWLFENEELSSNGDTFGFSFICEALDFHKDELLKAVRRQHDEQNTKSTKISPEHMELGAGMPMVNL